MHSVVTYNSDQIEMWLSAFVITSVIEMPVYLWALRYTDHSQTNKILISLTPSIVTHPLIWWGIPPLINQISISEVSYYILVEVIAVLGEYFFLKKLKCNSALSTSLIANGCSATLGSYLFDIYYF